MGKRWNNPALLAELAETECAPELIKFWRSPVFGEKFSDVPAFLLSRLAEMATDPTLPSRSRTASWLTVPTADPVTALPQLRSIPVTASSTPGTRRAEWTGR